MHASLSIGGPQLLLFALTVSRMDGEVVRTLTGPGTAGIHRIHWDLREDPIEPPEGSQDRPRPGALLDPGTYRVTMTVNGQDSVQSVVILEDIWMDQVGG